MNWYKTSIKKPYLQKIKTVDRFTVWEVDGNYIRDNIDLQFNNFGEHNRFKFIPKNEFWIDSASAEPDEIPFYIEYMFYFSKEIEKGKKYDDAVDIASDKEEKDRKKSPKKNIYIKLIKKVNDLKIWFVNGKSVRDTYLIDFTAGGHDRVYDFVPKNEVWIDNEINPEEVDIVLTHELYERYLMGKGMGYDKAHNRASALEKECRIDSDRLKKTLKRELERYNNSSHE